MHIVIGSGPAGVSAAKAILANGRDVLMIDCGREMPAAQQKLIEKLRQQTPSEWIIPEREQRGIPKKKLFDSTYMYDTPGMNLRARNADVTASFAKGGLSMVWGASMLPYPQSELRNWGVSLDAYYKKVLEFVPLAGTKDDLAKQFPLHTTPQRLQCSPQIAGLMKGWEEKKKDLKKKNIIFGQSRVAIRAYPEGNKQGCVYCGWCMAGCPYNAIYNAQWTLNELLLHPKFSYVKGRVTKVAEGPEGAVAFVGAKQFAGEKIFLAAGAFGTADVLLNSTAREELTLRDSQYLIIPALTTHKGRTKELFSLAQAFVEARVPGIGHAHLQVYPYSALVEKSIATKLGRIYKFLKPFINIFARRLVVIQAFLHSDVSGKLNVQKTADGLRITGRASSQGKKLPGFLLKHVFALRLLPLIPLVEYGLPGKSVHMGASLPMRKDPDNQESDLLGRSDFKHVHVVDASVLPAISGATITLTAMANAYRIAHEVTK